jgi:hypothetical protein
MFSDEFTRLRIVTLIIALTTTLSFGPLYSRQASAEDSGTDLKARFDTLSQHGNVECSVQFEKSVATMPADGRLQGSCCAPMDEARYRQQIEGLKKYADIAEVPSDPYDISAPLAHTLMGYYTLALNKDEQAAYDYAMRHSDMQVRVAANAGAGRCMAAWANTLSARTTTPASN